MTTAAQIKNQIAELQTTLADTIRHLERSTKQQVDALQKQLKTVELAETKHARAAILAILAEHGLSADAVLAALPTPRTRAVRTPPPPPTVHYEGPNGELWMGRGPHPLWLKNSGKDKSAFEKPGPMPADNPQLAAA